MSRAEVTILGYGSPADTLPGLPSLLLEGEEGGERCTCHRWASPISGTLPPVERDRDSGICSSAGRGHS